MGVLTIDERVKCLVETGHLIQQILSVNHVDELSSEGQQNLFHLVAKVQHQNNWFSEWNVRNALAGIASMLSESDLLDWLANYYKSISSKEKKSVVGLVMAGNIPLVGFHDFVCVFLAGDKAHVKLSSDDDKLFPALLDLMKSITPEISACCLIQEQKLTEVEKVIATGSNNTARYFEYYFSKYPNIIRKSRTSLAIINEEDGDDIYRLLAKDLFYYYGMGCRNVSKLFVPKNFDVVHFIDVLREFEFPMDGTKYTNNLEYNKSIMLINGVKFLDAGFFFLKEDKSLFSPISIIHFEFYENRDSIATFIDEHKNEIQCVVSSRNEYGVLPGQAQFPKLWDYADNVDVMEFLLRA